MAMNEPVIITAAEMRSLFFSILIKQGLTEEKAALCADTFTNNSVDGVSTHGVNRFARFIEYIKKGVVDIHAVPALVNSSAALEQWNGNAGPGITNAFHATARAMKIAKQYGIGCVALANTNHWMRGGSYGWKAAKEGFAFISWTNTIAIMPAWNAVDNHLGNNPLVMAVPYGDEAIVLDMAMSQYSFGALELAAMKHESLTVQGGFNKAGELTNDPATIIESGRPLPIGYWKGAGLTLLLDVLATVLSGGLSTQQMSQSEIETGISQVFIAVDLSRLHNYASIANMINNIINDYMQSVPVSADKQIKYPGQRIIETRSKNLQHGIPVVKKVWDEILSLQ